MGSSRHALTDSVSPYLIATVEEARRGGRHSANFGTSRAVYSAAWTCWVSRNDRSPASRSEVPTPFVRPIERLSRERLPLERSWRRPESSAFDLAHPLPVDLDRGEIHIGDRVWVEEVFQNVAGRLVCRLRLAARPDVAQDDLQETLDDVEPVLAHEVTEVRVAQRRVESIAGDAGDERSDLLRCLDPGGRGGCRPRSASERGHVTSDDVGGASACASPAAAHEVRRSPFEVTPGAAGTPAEIGRRTQLPALPDVRDRRP